jgi:hypothetical protein
MQSLSHSNMLWALKGVSPLHTYQSYLKKPNATYRTNPNLPTQNTSFLLIYLESTWRNIPGPAFFFPISILPHPIPTWNSNGPLLWRSLRLNSAFLSRFESHIRNFAMCIPLRRSWCLSAFFQSHRTSPTVQPRWLPETTSMESNHQTISCLEDEH